MQDEARHVAFGRLALRDYYPQLTQTERDEREEFAVEACYLHARPLPRPRRCGRRSACRSRSACRYVRRSRSFMRMYRTALFTRIVPTIKDIGLWGPRIRKAYADMGILGFADVDAEALLAKDEQVADDFDARRAPRP